MPHASIKSREILAACSLECESGGASIIVTDFSEDRSLSSSLSLDSTVSSDTDSADVMLDGKLPIGGVTLDESLSTVFAIKSVSWSFSVSSAKGLQ